MWPMTFPCGKERPSSAMLAGWPVWPVGRFGRFTGPQLVERNRRTAVLAMSGPLLISVDNWVIFGGLWTRNLFYFDGKIRNLSYNRTLEARGSTPLSST